MQIITVGVLFFVAACDDMSSTAPFQLNILYTVNGLGDQSFADSVYEGVVRGGLETDFTTCHAMPSDVFEAKNMFEQWVVSSVNNRTVDADQSDLGSGVIVGSVVKRLDSVVEQALVHFGEGDFVPGHTSVGMSDAGTEFVLNDVFLLRVSAAVDAAFDDAILAAGGYYGVVP